MHGNKVHNKTVHFGHPDQCGDRPLCRTSEEIIIGAHLNLRPSGAPNPDGRPPPLTMKKTSSQHDEILRLQYDLSYMKAELARYQQKHGVAMKFLQEIRRIGASGAGMVGILQQAENQALWSQRERTHALLHESLDPHGHVTRCVNRVRDTLQHVQESRRLLQTNWTSLEQACNTLVADEDRIDNEYNALFDKRATWNIHL